MIPWWGGICLFFVGIYTGILIIALINADRGG